MINLFITPLATIILTLLNSLANTTPVQEWRQAESTSSNLALEVTYYQDKPPTYLAVVGHNSKPSWAWYSNFRRVSSWAPPAGSLPARAVNIRPRLEGDAVRIEVSVYLGVRFHEEEKHVSSHLIRENEKISIVELTKFGVEPFEIKVVRVTQNLAIHPQVTSQAGSISVVSVEANSSTLPSYKITLQNLSSRCVMALGVEGFANGQKRLISMPQGKEGEPLITPGAVYELNTSGPRDVALSSEGYRPNAPQFQEIVITAAMFDDNSFEGDTITAARFRALAIGRKIQVTRLLSLIQSIDDSTELNTSSELNKLKSQFSSLSDNVEAPVVDRLMQEFPTLSADLKESLKRGIEVASHGVKVEIIRDLQMFENPGSQSPDAQSLRKWLKIQKGKYEKWLSRL